jgi:hypothetical protein
LSEECAGFDPISVFFSVQNKPNWRNEIFASGSNEDNLIAPKTIPMIDERCETESGGVKPGEDIERISVVLLSEFPEFQNVDNLTPRPVRSSHQQF